jgi:hypothetical protein
MSVIHHKLQAVIYDMMSLNKTWQQEVSKHPQCLSIIDFAKSYQTVSYNPGRHTGASTFIARSVGSDDVVIAPTLTIVKTLDERIKSFNPDYTIPVRVAGHLNPSEFRGRSLIDVVYVDAASCIKKDYVDSIYDIFAGNCNQFVFLG